MKFDREELRELFRRELALCQVTAGESVVIVSEGDELRTYAQIFYSAAEDLKAIPTDLNLPARAPATANERLAKFGVFRLSKDEPAMQTLKAAGLVIDLMVLSFSRVQNEVQEGGARILLVAESPGNLGLLFPTEDQRMRSERSGELLSQASRFRFTNPLGTDVTYELGAYPVLVEYGYTDKPGRWDHWGGSLAATCAHTTGVNGRVVMNEGDMVLPQLKLLSEPVEFVIKDGCVVEINGGEESRALRDFIESYDDDRAYAVSHIGWGTNERAAWKADGLGMNGRSYYGNVLFSLGPNLEFGGMNDTACHLDLPMRNCSGYLDDEPIIIGGQFVPRDLSVTR